MSASYINNIQKRSNSNPLVVLCCNYSTSSGKLTTLELFRIIYHIAGGIPQILYTRPNGDKYPNELIDNLHLGSCSEVKSNFILNSNELMSSNEFTYSGLIEFEATEKSDHYFASIYFGDVITGSGERSSVIVYNSNGTSEANAITEATYSIKPNQFIEIFLPKNDLNKNGFVFIKIIP